MEVEVGQFFGAPVRATTVLRAVPDEKLPQRYTVLSAASGGGERNECAMAHGGLNTAWKGDIIVVKHTLKHPRLLVDIAEEEVEEIYKSVVGLGLL